MRIWSLELLREYWDHQRRAHRRVGRSPSQSHAGSHCDGYRECLRRRHQIAAGTLMSTERIAFIAALRRTPSYIGVDLASDPDREVLILKNRTVGKTTFASAEQVP